MVCPPIHRQVLGQTCERVFLRQDYLEEFPQFTVFNMYKYLIIKLIAILVGELRPSGAIPPLAGKRGPFEDEPAPS
jgi:hypothetical protein